MTIERWRTEENVMLKPITLALAVVIALVATIPALTRPGSRLPALSGASEGRTAMPNMASGGGNLVPLW
jgi:hypothetical protein